MKIFHGIANISGMAGILAAAQRDLGHNAVSYCLTAGNFDFPADHVFSNNDVQRLAELWKFFLLEAGKFDVFHFYFGGSLTGPRLLDVPILINRGIKVFFYFCGCDIRDSKHVIATQPVSACAECWPMACSANRDWARKIAMEFATGTFVSTPDLLEFLPDSTLLPQPLSLEKFDDLALTVAPQMKRDHRICRIVHGPSNRAIKGTKYLLEAVETLQKEGVPVELKLIEGMRHADAMRACRDADIAIDQLLIGAYGQFSVEMMALGKPVICYIRDDLRDFYTGDLPIISADPSSITRVLRQLVEHRDRWEALGQRGRAYVRDVHDSAIVARQALERYSQ